MAAASPIRARLAASEFVAQVLPPTDGAAIDPLREDWINGRVSDIDFIEASVFDEDQAVHERGRTLMVLFAKATNASGTRRPAPPIAEVLEAVAAGTITVEQLQEIIGPWYGELTLNEAELTRLLPNQG